MWTGMDCGNVAPPTWLPLTDLLLTYKCKWTHAAHCDGEPHLCANVPQLSNVRQLCGVPMQVQLSPRAVLRSTTVSESTHPRLLRYCSNRWLTFDQGSLRAGVYECTCVQETHSGSAHIPAFTALLFCKVRTWPRAKKKKKTGKESEGRQTNVEDKAERIKYKHSYRKVQDTKVMQIGRKETL